MVESYCSYCRNRQAEFLCRQCHKPLCDECAFKTDLGVFCNRECANQFRDFHRSAARSKSGSGPGLVRILIYVILLAAVGLAVAWWRGWLPEQIQARIDNRAGTVREKVEEGVKDLKDKSNELMEQGMDTAQ